MFHKLLRGKVGLNNNENDKCKIIDVRTLNKRRAFKRIINLGLKTVRSKLQSRSNKVGDDEKIEPIFCNDEVYDPESETFIASCELRDGCCYRYAKL